MEEIIRSEHRAIVFKMNRKQAATVARYIKDHSGSSEMIFAVDVDTQEMILQVLEAENADEDDEATYVSVEDDDVLQAVFDLFKEQAGDEFDFAD